MMKMKRPHADKVTADIHAEKTAGLSFQSRLFRGHVMLVSEVKYLLTCRKFCKEILVEDVAETDSAWCSGGNT